MLNAYSPDPHPPLSILMPCAHITNFNTNVPFLVLQYFLKIAFRANSAGWMDTLIP